MAEDLIMQALRDIADRLRSDTGASRTTIRFDSDRLNLRLETVAVESRIEGVRALEGQETPGAREGAAITWLRRNRRTFVMEDCLHPWAPEVAPEEYVVNLYGIRSEMVTGVFRGDELIGVISVHYTGGPRKWRDEEVAMIERASSEVRALLDDLEGV